MFYKNNLAKFRLFRLFSDLMKVQHGQRDYVFLEDTGDISGTDLIPYESFVEPNATGQIVKFTAVESGYSFYELFYFRIITEILKISAELIITGTSHNALERVIIGDCDIFLIGVVGFAQTNTFLPTGIDALSIWVKNLEYTSSQFFFLNSFTLQLWICYLSALLLCIMWCWCFQKCLQRIFSQSHYISIDVFNFISLLFDQGGGSSSRIAISIKFILITYLGLLIIFYGSFDAFLSSLLAIKKMNLPFDNLEGLLQQPDYILCNWQQANLEPYIRSYSRGHYNISVEINNPNYCPRAAKNLFEYFDSNFSCEYEKLAFLGSIWTINNIKSQCGLASPIKGNYLPQHRSGFVYSGFPYRQQFNVLILKMKSSGISDVLSRRHPSIPVIEYSSVQNIIPIDFNHISLILKIFISGIICALLVLLAEIMYAKIMERKKPQGQLFILH